MLELLRRRVFNILIDSTYDQPGMRA